MTEALGFQRSMDVTYGTAIEVAPGVRRIVARNPGPLTFKGTNTYLVGHRDVAVIDPGPGDPAHLRAILAEVGRGRVTHILLTHTHRDHSAGIPALQRETGAKTYAHGSPGERREAAAQHTEAKPFLQTNFEPDVSLVDGQMMAGHDWALQAVHTPGHAPDHLCFELVGKGVLFSGDHVMGWNTTVIAPPEGRMSDYLSSLERLLAIQHVSYLSGHGDTISEPHRLIRSYLLHRRMRESMVADAVKDGLSRVEEITQRVYRGVNGAVFTAARMSVLAHLEHLMERGLILCDEATPSLTAQYLPAS
jgi:glyoxylase-like metal-dependent hydrolase (beta-lactamase superfamily II)